MADVSGETADLVVKETMQITEGAIKLAGIGLKNVAAFLIAISNQNNKVVGKTTARRLARDPAPAEIIHLKKEDMARFQKLAKQYGVLYFFVHKRDAKDGITNVVSNANYAPQLNAIMEELGYPIPQKTQEAETPKKAVPRTQPEKSSPGRENGSKQRAGTSTDEKPSVRGRLAALEAASKGMDRPKIPVREPTR